VAEGQSADFLGSLVTVIVASDCTRVVRNLTDKVAIAEYINAAT